MADQTKTIKVDVKNNFRKTADDGKKMNKVVFDTKSAINDVLKSGKSYENQLKDVNKIVKETPLNVRDMNKQIQAYQSIALSAGRETPVGKEALKKAADLRDRYIDIQNETKRLADDQKNLQGVMQLASTGVAGFGAVQSSMALMGGESEALRETMTKLMAAQTLLNSINQIATALEKESSAMLLLKSIKTKILTSSMYAYATAQGVATKGAKLLRLALIGTGIGALVVGVGLLVANFGKVKKAVSNAIKKFKFLKLAFTPLIIAIEAVKKGLKLLGIGQGKNAEQEKADAKRREQEAKADEDRWNAKRDRLNKEYDLKQKLAQKEIDLAKAKGKDTAEAERKIITDAIAKAEKDRAEERKKFDEEAKYTIDSYQKRVDEQKKALEVLQKIRENGIRDKSDLSRKEQKILEHANANIYTHTFDMERKLEASNERLNKFREKESKKWIKTSKGDVESLQKDLEIFDANEVKSNKDKLKQKQDNYKTYLQNRLNARRKIEDLENSLLEDGIEKELEINSDKFRRLIEDTKKNENLKGEEKQKIIDLYASQEIQSAKLINLKYEKIAKDRIKIEEKAAVYGVKITKEMTNEEIKILTDAAQKKYEAGETAREKGIAKQTALDNLEISLMKDKHLQEALLLTQQYDAKFALAEGNAELELQLQKQLAEDIEAIDEKHRKIQEDKDEDELEGKIGRAMAIAQVTADGLQLISGFADKFAGDDLERQKKAFKIKKVADIAQAGIDATKASLSAYAGTPGGPVVKGIAAGVAGGFGLLQIAKIKSAKFDSPSGGGGVSSAPQGAITSSGGPNVNIVGENGINQLEALQGQANGVTKAYVVSDEVTTAQALDRKIEDFATL